MPDKVTFKAEFNFGIEATIDDEKVTESIFVNGYLYKTDTETFSKDFTRDDVIKKFAKNAGTKERFAAFMLKNLGD